MIGKPLSQRHGFSHLVDDRAVAILKESLASYGEALVRVRVEDARMVACLIVRADRDAVRLCRALGLRMTLGATGVVGLLGADAARFFSELPAAHRAWLETPCGAQETKVFLVAGGIALLSIETDAGKVVVTAVG
jgi:hypothetical protein